jgi:hypothetical protein
MSASNPGREKHDQAVRARERLIDPHGDGNYANYVLELLESDEETVVLDNLSTGLAWAVLAITSRNT